MKLKSKLALASAALILAAYAPARAAPNDDRIESAAESSYVFKTYLKADDVDVDAEDGVVTLSGTVKDTSHKTLAADTVAELPGVARVVNEIEVEEGAPSEGSDLWLAAKVKTALLFSSNVSGLDTEVSARNGVVTLKGVADTEAQKELTGKRAEDVKGVKSVANEIRVPGSEKPMTAKAADEAERIGDAIERGIDDASITAQAKMALLTSKSTSAIKTDVDTERGVVTVTGEASNEAEKELVTELLKDIRGVKDVKNAMTVAPSS